jgi:hypothetical protein
MKRNSDGISFKTVRWLAVRYNDLSWSLNRQLDASALIDEFRVYEYQEQLYHGPVCAETNRRYPPGTPLPK